MDFKNLDVNILDILGEAWSKSDSPSPFKVSLIYREFSDIPDEHITTALRLLHNQGYLAIHSDYRDIYLTQKGMAEIESLRECLNEFSSCR